MKNWFATIALAGALWGCDAKTPPPPVVTAPPPAPTATPAPEAAAKVDGPTYTERIKIDDV